jgi:hypothetical protein
MDKKFMIFSVTITSFAHITLLTSAIGYMVWVNTTLLSLPLLFGATLIGGALIGLTLLLSIISETLVTILAGPSLETFDSYEPPSTFITYPLPTTPSFSLQYYFYILTLITASVLAASLPLTFILVLVFQIVTLVNGDVLWTPYSKAAIEKIFVLPAEEDTCLDNDAYARLHL